MARVGLTVFLILVVLFLLWWFLKGSAKPSQQAEQEKIVGKSVMDPNEGTYASV